MFVLALLIYLDPPWWVWLAAVFSFLADVRFLCRLIDALPVLRK